MSKTNIIIALDYDKDQKALDLVAQLNPKECKLKVGKNMFTRYGPEFVKILIRKGFDVFLDLKFHDIPTTVALACKAAAELGVWMLNVHASGGLKMLQAAQEAISTTPLKPKLIAVTVLTSMNEADLNEIGVSETLQDHVLRLAHLGQRAKLDGVVCSAEEAPLLRQAFGKNFCLVTPGIRLSGSDANDQKRLVTPKEAIARGSDYLVIGRPITGAVDPKLTLAQVLDGLRG